MDTSGEQIAYSCPDFLFTVEVYGGRYVFAHVTFHRWSVSAFRQCVSVFRNFKNTFAVPVYCYGKDASDKFTRFVDRLGFKPLGSTIVLNNGAVRPVFISI